MFAVSKKVKRIILCLSVLIVFLRLQKLIYSTKLFPSAEYKMEYLLWLMTLNSVTNPWIYLAFNQEREPLLHRNLVSLITLKSASLSGICDPFAKPAV